MTAEDLLKLDKFKEKKVANVLSAIEKSKDVSLESLIFALGIENVGQKTAKDLASKYGNLDNLAKATAEDLTAMQDIGEIVAQISTACEEQSMATKQLTAAIEEVSGVIQTNSATSEESAAASAELQS